jgi:hypothetical protein
MSSRIMQGLENQRLIGHDASALLSCGAHGEPVTLLEWSWQGHMLNLSLCSLPRRGGDGGVKSRTCPSVRTPPPFAEIVRVGSDLSELRVPRDRFPQ